MGCQVVDEDYGVVGLKRKLRMGGKVNRRGRKFSRSLRVRLVGCSGSF